MRPGPGQGALLAPLGWIERIARVGPCAFELDAWLLRAAIATSAAEVFD